MLTILEYIIAYIIVLIVYMSCPKECKVLIFIVNLFVPDPLPYIDEIIMGLGLFAD